VDIETCEAHNQLKLDAEFNKLTAALWPLLDETGKREFVNAHRAWLTYSVSTRSALTKPSRSPRSTRSCSRQRAVRGA
jgi:hypothetical protein